VDAHKNIIAKDKKQPYVRLGCSGFTLAFLCGRIKNKTFKDSGGENAKIRIFEQRRSASI